MKILVTGSHGFIGSYLTDKLTELGHELTLVDLKNNCYYSDILDNVQMLTLGQNQDAIIHLAALTSVQESNSNAFIYTETNINGTISLLESARFNKIPQFIFASSAAVIKPVSVYASTKIAGETYCKTYSYLYNFNSVILRFFNVYGNGSKGIIPIILNSFKNNEKPTIYGGNQTRDFVYISDVVDAIVLALEYKDTATFDVASGTSLSVNEIIKKCQQYIPGEVIYKPELRGEIRVSESNISRTIKQLGYSPKINIDEGIKLMVGDLC